MSKQIIDIALALGCKIMTTHIGVVPENTCDPSRVYNAFAEGGFEQLVAETGELFAETPLGKGQVDWDEYLNALCEINYNGFLTIEREVSGDPVEDISTAINFLKQKLK